MNNNNNNNNNNTINDGTGPNIRVPTITQHTSITRRYIVSRQRLRYTDRQRQSDTNYYVFSYKIHPAVLILPAVLTQSINMDMSVQTKV
jgi:hypothetical protein